MSSRREEERNEKIIRGLMKLPPNRRCINCNSLVPQYICTNFWTFVCTTCSGIHREFTHRVKSVSMAKFTTQELEALQNGGNQRAREIYLKDWDAQGLRLPDNSKPDKIREFIKNVYVDKKYAGGKSSEKPSRDMQLSGHEDEIRRASSYHSYSQSPPYDFQYEERRYGKRAPNLSRNPGSDSGLHYKKFSSFLSPNRLSERSPDRVSDHVYEDRFPMERSNSRASDCSVFSGSDPFKSDVQSPNFQKDRESLSSQTSRDFFSEDLNCLRNSNVDLFAMADGGSMSQPQRTASTEVSDGVLDKQMGSSKRNDSVVLVDLAPEPIQIFKPHLSNHAALPSLTHMSSDGLDLFNIPFAPQNMTSTAPSIDTSTFSEFPSTAPVDLFQSSTASLHQQPQASPPYPALFSNIPQQSPSASFPEKSSDLLVPPSEGWATFDIPQHSMCTENSKMMKLSSNKSSMGNLGQLTPNQSSSFPDVSPHGPSSSVLDVSRDAPHNIGAVSSIENTQLWNVFEDSNGQVQLETVHGICKEAPESQKYGIQSVLGPSVSPMPSVPSHGGMPLHNLSGLPVGGHSYSLNNMSTNPFDLPCDPSLDYSHVSNLWDMNSLQATLPNGQMPTSFTAGANQPWFSDNAIGPFYPAGSEGVLEFIAGQGSSTPIMNGQSKGTVAPVGGNPFA